MRPFINFRTPEEEDEQKISRPVSESVKSTFPFMLCLNLFGVVILFTYGYLFFESLQGRWFDPRWTTDDSLQQAFIFHEVNSPGVFVDDIISEMMTHYLSPIHYWLGTVITHFTKDPLMTGHWIMLIQITLALGFLFAAVKHAAGFFPACITVVWFLYTRNTIQRISGGLQRGWAPALLAAYIYFLYRGSHRAIYVLIGISWLLHAPSALLISISYGLYLLWKFLQIDTRSTFKKPLITLICLVPLYALLAFYGVKKPEHLGKMVSYEAAASMPEFSNINGRFKMVPFWPRWQEIEQFGFQAFNSSLTKGPEFLENYAAPIVILFCLGLLYFARRGRHRVSVSQAVTLLLGILITYEASRMFAFKLFVPQRYIQIPMAILFITFIPILIWQVFSKNSKSSPPTSRARATGAGLGAMFAVAAFVYCTSGSGLTGDANFNMPRFIRGDLWPWVRNTLPKDAIIAGYPSYIDGVQLFGQRRGFVTNETSHPFYDLYYAEIKRRIELSLRAHYARDLEEVGGLLLPEGVTHFVFRRKAFYPEALAKATYFSPFDKLISELTSRPADEYAFKQIPRELDLENHPYQVYRDDESVVIDLKKIPKKSDT